MNWEYWRQAFKKYLPADYVDNEIDRYMDRSQNRDAYPDEDQYLEDVQYMFEHVYQSLVEKHTEDSGNET